MKLIKKIFFVVVLGLLVAPPAHAAIIPACALGTGVPQLSCFLELAVSISQFILGLTGSLALLFFVYGGFVFLTSRGASDQITKGKTILTQAAIGIIIIFGAYIGISFLTTAIGGKFTTQFNIEKPVTPAQTPKCEYCYCKDLLGTDVPQGAGSTEDACKTSCSNAIIGGQKGGYSFSKCGSPPSGTPTTPSTISSCHCICSNGYEEDISNGDVTYPAIGQCKSLCIIKGQGIQMTSCK